MDYLDFELSIEAGNESVYSHAPLFVSYARKDLDVVTRLYKDLQRFGITLWIDYKDILPGSADWEDNIRKALRSASGVLLVVTPHILTSPYIKGELDIARLYQRPVYPLWIEGIEWVNEVPMGWTRVQYIDARGERYEKALAQLVQLVQKRPSSPASPSQPTKQESAVAPRNPYKGLQAFTSADARDFFGREQLIAEMVDGVNKALEKDPVSSEASRLVAVIGPSGSGKSSVVLAGLLPRLHQNVLPASRAWIYLEHMTPGTHPLEELARTLAYQFPARSYASLLEDLTASSARGLHLLTQQLAQPKQTLVVLLIDQFEELFTQTTNVAEREQFVHLLTTAANEPEGSLLIILTLRADFSDRPMQYPVLYRLLQAHQLAVLPMESADLRKVIEQPAALPDVQLNFEDDLVGDLLFELRGQVGALPLLEFTLDQLFQRRTGRHLTRQAYQEIGGVKGALAKHAEDTYNEQLPSEEHRRLAWVLFLRLLEPGASEQETTRRRAALSEFVFADQRQARLMQETIEIFVKARLLTTTTNENAGKNTIEVSHEALIREWPRLVGWLREAREDIRLQQSISEDAAEWERHNKPRDRLYRGAQFKEAQAWARRNMVSKQEQTFLQASAAGQLRSLIAVIAVIFLVVTSSGIAGWLYLNRPHTSNYVTTTDEYAVGSLRWAIGSASSESTITFAPNLVGQTILLKHTDIHIFQQHLTLQGPATGRITIREIGAGLIVDKSASATISNIAFQGSNAKDQLSLIRNQGTLTLNSSTISGNTISVDISNDTVIGFYRGGGGIYNYGTLTLNNSTITGNKVTGVFSSGGGIYNDSTLTLNNSTITGNTAQNNNGGGISNNGTLTLNNSSVTGNKVTGFYGGGGGIYNDSTLTLNNSSVTGNTATNGGGIFIQGLQGRGNTNGSSFSFTQTDLTFSTIYGNNAHSGADIAIEDLDFNRKLIKQHSQVKIRNSIVVGDPAHPGPDVVGMLMSYGYNLLQDNSGATFDPATSRQHGTDKTLSVNELTKVFADPVELSENSGPTKTLALAPDSPAIDAIPLDACHVTVPIIPIRNSLGTPVAQYTITTDQRGMKRPDNGEDRCDIGAYEYEDGLT